MTDDAALARLREQVDAALAAHVDGAVDRLVGLHPALGALGDELRAFVLGGGKRLRPLFVLTGHRAGGGTDPDEVMGAAVALELLHTFALMHDDVIDEAPTRRGRPATHVSFAGQHRRAGWAGDPDGYGRAVAILLGDLVFVHAAELFHTCRVATPRLLRAHAVFTTLCEEVMGGQYLDLYASRSRRTDRELALAVTSYKAGRYTVARPLQIGAVLAGADEPVIDGLVRFGLPLGQAFQLRDDVLGVFGAESATGKPASVDLAEGKRTVLVAEAAARLDAAGRDELERLLAAGEGDERAVAVLQDLLRTSGALAATEKLIAELRDQALEVLDTLAVEAGAAEVLRTLADRITRRSR